MMHSESIASLAAALVAAQSELKAVAKDSKNQHFNSTFASLGATIEEVRPVLASHDLAVLQSAVLTSEGKTLDVETRLVHKSGEWLASTTPVPIAKMDPQGAGSALTYGRRYGLQALLCLSTENDDDGNAASRPQPAKRSAPRAEPSPASNGAPKRNVASEIASYTGAPADRVMPFGHSKGKTLRELDKTQLDGALRWCLEKDDPKFAPLIKDIRAVLTDKALGVERGPKVQPELTDDQRVARMKTTAETDDLPF